MTTIFETEVCSRCGGTGNYSYNQIDGTRCFKCRGDKVALTKRGAAAQAYFFSMQQVPAINIKPGDVIAALGYNRLHVTEVFVKPLRHKPGNEGDWIESPYLYIGNDKNGIHVPPNHIVRRLPTAAQKAEQVALALAYQATLTKAGTPRKTAR